MYIGTKLPVIHKSTSGVDKRRITWRVFGLQVEPDFDGAEGEGQELGDLLVGREAGAAAREEGGGVEQGSAASLQQVDAKIPSDNNNNKKQFDAKAIDRYRSKYTTRLSGR
jgi:hypothetical protein